MITRARLPSPLSLIVLISGLTCLGALFSRELLVRDARTLLLSCGLSVAGVCGLSALLCSVSGRPTVRRRLTWALTTGAIVGFAWWVRVGVARLFNSAEADFVSAGALADPDAVPPELRAGLTGLAVGAVVFWCLVAAIGAAQRLERRRRTELRRRARAAWRGGAPPGSV